MKDKEVRIRIGLRIAEIRELRGMTQAELAEKAGFRQANISAIENAKYGTTIDVLSRIAEALNVRIDFIID